MGKTIYTKEHKNIVNQLKLARKEAQLEQIEVANLLGKTQSYISKVESGQRKVDIVMLKELARIYKKDIEFFIGNNE